MSELDELVAQAVNTPVIAEASADVTRLQAEVRKARDKLDSALRGIQIAKEKAAGTLVTGGSVNVLSLEEAVEKEKTARLWFETTEQALTASWALLKEVRREARRDVVPELARRHAESIKKLAAGLETARDAELEMRETEAAANTVLGRQSLIRVFMPAWISLFYHDGHHEVDRVADFREKAAREVEVIAGLEQRGGKSAKPSAKPAKSDRLGVLKRIFAT